MPLRDLVTRCRSYRRFHQDQPISLTRLEALVGLARLTASAANRQPLRYVLCADSGVAAALFETLAWAACLPDWPGPAPGERPPAYIVILGDERFADAVATDLGVAAQTIMLGAVEMGYGGCMIGSFQAKALARIIAAPAGFAPRLVLALGRPLEEVVVEPLAPDGDVRYWRDERGVHHVPKRALAELIVGRHGT